MSVKVSIAASLRQMFSVPSTVEVKGNTVAECIDDLVRQYPEARNWILNQNDVMPVFIAVKNKETVVVDKNNLDRRIGADAEIQIFGVIGGG
jgi:molybdopterin converting factor small subunit